MRITKVITTLHFFSLLDETAYEVVSTHFSGRRFAKAKSSQILLDNDDLQISLINDELFAVSMDITLFKRLRYIQEYFPDSRFSGLRTSKGHEFKFTYAHVSLVLYCKNQKCRKEDLYLNSHGKILSREAGWSQRQSQKRSSYLPDDVA